MIDQKKSVPFAIIVGFDDIVHNERGIFDSTTLENKNIKCHEPGASFLQLIKESSSTFNFDKEWKELQEKQNLIHPKSGIHYVVFYLTSIAIRIEAELGIGNEGLHGIVSNNILLSKLPNAIKSRWMLSQTFEESRKFVEVLHIYEAIRVIIVSRQKNLELAIRYLVIYGDEKNIIFLPPKLINTDIASKDAYIPQWSDDFRNLLLFLRSDPVSKPLSRIDQLFKEVAGKVERDGNKCIIFVDDAFSAFVLYGNLLSYMRMTTGVDVSSYPAQPPSDLTLSNEDANIRPHWLAGINNSPCFFQSHLSKTLQQEALKQFASHEPNSINVLIATNVIHEADYIHSVKLIIYYSAVKSISQASQSKIAAVSSSVTICQESAVDRNNQPKLADCNQSHAVTDSELNSQMQTSPSYDKVHIINAKIQNIRKKWSESYSVKSKKNPVSVLWELQSALGCNSKYLSSHTRPSPQDQWKVDVTFRLELAHEGDMDTSLHDITESSTGLRVKHAEKDAAEKVLNRIGCMIGITET
eukprot:Tbor_TRINITY_DN5742_c0_g2::TRINITY_DN5742_c0_g2_i11::g.20136::m.20136